ncbi:MAG: SpoIVB peptidase [Bacilli bacterium]|nr:SpoIVB peptidase [Bacilli bacterium]
MFSKHKIQTFLLLFLINVIIPLNVFAYSDYIIASGKNIGIELKSKGIIIVDTYKVMNNDPARDSGLQVGDKIFSVNNIYVSSIEDMLNVINNSIDKTSALIGFYRGNKKLSTTLKLFKDSDDTYKTGLYVKDSIVGVGTLTFIDPNTKIYGALGHEIIEKTTGQKFEIKDGKIYSSSVTSINPSNDGDPGEKNARYDTNDIYGDIKENTSAGIFGNYSATIPNNKLFKVTSPEDIKLGEASILTVTSGNEIDEYSINILKVFKENTNNKNILFEITDNNLLNLTGGIVQGMSGSPIIQNDNIIGAVTHVVVDDCTKGYGIFITNMLEEAEN